MFRNCRSVLEHSDIATSVQEQPFSLWKMFIHANLHNTAGQSDTETSSNSNNGTMSTWIPFSVVFRLKQLTYSKQLFAIVDSLCATLQPCTTQTPFCLIEVHWLWWQINFHIILETSETLLFTVVFVAVASLSKMILSKGGPPQR